jgi:hypothetical protein
VRHPRASPGSLTQCVCRLEGGRSRKSLPFALWFPSPPLLNRKCRPMTKGLRASPDRMITPWFRGRQYSFPGLLPAFWLPLIQPSPDSASLSLAFPSFRLSFVPSSPPWHTGTCLIPPGPRKQNSYLCPGRSGWLSGSPFFGEVYRNRGSGRRCIATDAWPAERARSQVIQIRRIAIPIQQFARVFL